MSVKKKQEVAQGIFRKVVDVIDKMCVEFAPKLEDVGEIQQEVVKKLCDRYK